MWFARNLRTGEYLTATLNGTEMWIETTMVRDCAYSFPTMERAAVFAAQASDTFGIDGFEPVEE